MVWSWWCGRGGVVMVVWSCLCGHGGVVVVVVVVVVWSGLCGHGGVVGVVVVVWSWSFVVEMCSCGFKNHFHFLLELEMSDSKPTFIPKWNPSCEV